MFKFALNIAILIVLTNCTSAHAFTPDSVYKHFPEVQVEAERTVFAQEKKFAAFTEISKSDIISQNPKQVSDLLNRQPGISIRDYGGLGGLKTISLRGTSSQQTLFMLEGMPLNSAGNSYLDLSIFPVSMINSIDIIRGGSSALFGGSSIGGTVNINLQAEQTNQFRGEAYTGSFGEFTGAMNASLKISEVNFGIASEYLSSEGNFPFNSNQFGKEITYYRDNSEFENFNLLLNLSSISKKYTLKLLTLGNISNRGAPGPVVHGYQTPVNAKLIEKGITGIFKIESGDDSFAFNTGILFKYNNLNYINSDDPFLNDSSNNFFTKSFRLNSSYSILSDLAKLTFGFEVEYSDITGDFIYPGLDRKVMRLNYGLSTRLYGDLYRNSSAALAYQLGARYDIYLDVSASPSAMSGLSLILNDYNLSISSQLAYNFRPPSFSEMYFLNYGTSDLKPERSTSFNLTTNYNSLNLHFSLNGFLINTLDQIVAVPKSTLTWSAQNMESVLSRGIEFTFSADIFKNIINTGLVYTLQRVTDNNSQSITYDKLIVYIPQELVQVYLNTSFYKFNIRLSGNYTGFTYSMSDNNYYSLIQSYFTGDIHIAKTFDVFQSKFRINFDIINIANKSFTVIRNYPMPGRFFRFGVSYEYPKK